MREWWKQLWCAHRWVKGFYYRYDWMRGQRDGWVCLKCGKVKYLPHGEQPISYVEK